jgi:hypothetical protein
MYFVTVKLTNTKGIGTLLSFSYPEEVIEGIPHASERTAAPSWGIFTDIADKFNNTEVFSIF